MSLRHFSKTEKLSLLLAIPFGLEDHSLPRAAMELLHHCFLFTSWCLLTVYQCLVVLASLDMLNKSCPFEAAVKSNGLALQFASETLKDDEEVVWCAVNQECVRNSRCLH